MFPAAAQQDASKLKVLATFSIPGDFAGNVGGDRLDVTTLVGPNGDVHVYTPMAADAEAIGNAGLVILNGLGLEGWLPRLVKSSGSSATTVVATHGIEPRKGETPSRDRGAGSIDLARVAIGCERRDLCRQHPRRHGPCRSGQRRDLQGQCIGLSSQAGSA
jgi:zinc/manganese transport system substrate-binding protein